MEQMELTSDSVGPPSPKTKISGIISDGSGVLFTKLLPLMNLCI